MLNIVIFASINYKEILYEKSYSLSLVANMFYYIVIGVLINVYFYRLNFIIMNIVLQVSDEETLKKIEEK